MLTLKKVNAELKGIGYKSELIRGEGYFYFVGPEADLFEQTGVYTYRINDLSLEGWIYDFEQKVLQAITLRIHDSEVLLEAVNKFRQVDRAAALAAIEARK